MPNSLAARTTRRSASTPRRWPSARGRLRAAAQRPLPSMMIATCSGVPERSGPSVKGIATFDIGEVPGSASCAPLTLNGEDFLFLAGQHLVDLRDHAVGGLLHVGGKTLLIVLGNLAGFFKLLERVEAVAANVANRDLGGF